MALPRLWAQLAQLALLAAAAAMIRLVALVVLAAEARPGVAETNPAGLKMGKSLSGC